ncbi:serine/threonine-protein kinase [Chondromyces crocatus]|uniref:Protein kinase domain-containing protein n=1 Tax=Chondromyces crocatus TaxID=52 RepID=A0A0K1EEI0_CHOCO|nr:serine/threonine-protein kinase [Chondromyces crocatus]AKT39276.1 uncharacterized protein CMC5_034240 [Chondromyces crocatus]
MGVLSGGIESRTQRLALRPDAGHETSASAPTALNRAPEPSLLDIDIDVDVPEEPIDVDALFDLDELPQAKAPFAPAPVPPPVVASTPSTPPRAAVRVERPSSPAAASASPVERPSNPAAPLVNALLPVSAAEPPPKPTAPLGEHALPALNQAEAHPVESVSQPPLFSQQAAETLTVRLSPAPVSADEPGPGSLISGRYRLEQIIGRGGMGAVWLARDTTLDIDVALKLIRRDRAAPEARVRLLQEARAAARIGHPSIVRIFDFGETPSGDPFIVMELLRGEPLSSILARRQRLAPALAVSTLLPLASALVAAHGKGIVHRDLKPDNILLVTNEAGALVPKLLDFGIARLLTGDSERRFTLAGEVLGSPDYMSPEQAKGEEDVGAATDVWAFTVVLYEAITGRRPFQGANYNALILAIITQEPTPITSLAAGDEALWTIVRRGLSKRAADRWQTMRDLGAALATWAIERSVQEDVSGTSIASHWLTGSRQRKLSVYPMGPPPSLSAAPVDPAVANGAFQLPPLRIPVASMETVTRPPFVPTQRRWGMMAAFLALGLIGTVAFLAVGAGAGRVAEESAGEAAASPPSEPSVELLTQEAPPAATADISPAEPTATALPVTASASVPAALPTATPRSVVQPIKKKPKRTAPPAPKDIRF